MYKNVIPTIQNKLFTFSYIWWRILIKCMFPKLLFVLSPSTGCDIDIDIISQIYLIIKIFNNNKPK